MLKVLKNLITSIIVSIALLLVSLLSKNLVAMPATLYMPIIILLLGCTVYISIEHHLLKKHCFDDETITFKRKLVIKKLTEPEKNKLRPFINQSKAQRPFSIDDGIIHSLCVKKILYKNSSVINYRATYKMYGWAWEYLNKHPKLLKQKGKK